MVLRDLLRRIGPAPVQLPAVNEEERLQSYPPPFPRGWYALMESHELSKGKVAFIEALGNKFVLYRGEDGAPGVLDAYCPHMGANLAGGKVRGNCLECPFHRWTFNGEGQVEHIPYAEKVGGGLKTQAWKARDLHGWLIVWYPGEGGRASMSEPDWEISPLEEISSGSFVYRGRHDAGRVRMHLCEFAENSADHRHFEPLHGDMFVPWTRLKVPGVRVIHEASWDRDQTESHISYFRDSAVLEIAGRKVERTGAKATITFYGPGGVVTFRFVIPEMGSIIMFQTHLPEKPLSQRVRFRWYAERKIPSALVSYVIGNWISQWREDISIWENKVYRDKPMLVPGDGPVHRMRAWFSQFY